MRITPLLRCIVMLLVAGFACASHSAELATRLEQEFAQPPPSARPWVYWWWLNGAASQEGITRDFEEMRKQGIGGALLFDAGAAGPDAPHGPQFMSSKWRELFKHALREADRCGIILGVNLCSGWDAGGPWVTHEHAAKKLVSTQTILKGPGRVSVALAKPAAVQGYYRDIAILAAPANSSWQQTRVVNLTKFVDDQGKLNWEAPAGDWKVVRIGCTLHGSVTSCVGGGPGGLEIDPMSASAMEAHFAATGAKLLADAGPLAGKTLQYFHVDSWELGQPTWTPRMIEEFEKRRGFDPLPWLPAVVGETVDNAESTRWFLQEYRRTAADLIAANYYGRLRELTLKGGLRGTHPESGGPFFTHWIDALQCEGINEVPMGEFWKRNSEPDGPVGHHHNPSLKQAACAAHIYGKRDCQAEAFTSFGDDWQDDPWSLKDIGDEAFCEGLTRNVLCFWIHQPRLEAMPGFQWSHVGTHFDCNLTWWPMSRAWLTYLARCQHLLRQGLFVADLAYLQDEAIPGFIPSRGQQQPVLPAGYDYDMLNAEVLLNRATAENGRLMLPDGMSYRYFVLPHQPDAVLSRAVLRRAAELAKAGVTVIGPKSLSAKIPNLRAGALDVILRADGLMPDVEFRNGLAGAKFDWIHRRANGTDFYFLSNQTTNTATAEIVFRVAGKQPELWDAVTGSIRSLPEWREENGRTLVPLKFEPRQSWFVVFRNNGTPKATSRKNFPEVKPVMEIAGAWEVAFEPKWGGPGQPATFSTLEDWSRRAEPGIRYYSGIAVYRKTFEAPSFATRSSALLLDLGVVKNVARVRLNGRDLGILWTAPWQVDISSALKPGRNELEIEVANLWPNRLIGDAALPKEKRFTTTNVPTYESILPPDNGLVFSTWGCKSCNERRKTGKPAALLASGLLGPVKVCIESN